MGLVISCSDKQNNSQKKDHNSTANDTVYASDHSFSEEDLQYNHEQTKSIKREDLTTTDDKIALQEMIVGKKLIKEEDRYILDYKYPYLDEEANPRFSVFNDSIQERFLDIARTENEILDDRKMLCDSVNGSIQKDRRILNYKVYQSKNNLLSVLFYKENYYAGMKHSTYSFDCLNFDLKRQQFVGFETMFKPGSVDVVFNKINTIIRAKINKGELYYECWEITKGDFGVYKNNFVIKDNAILYYFDDCVICPSYTGTYSVSIPIKEIRDIMITYSEGMEIS